MAAPAVLGIERVPPDHLIKLTRSPDHYCQNCGPAFDTIRSAADKILCRCFGAPVRRVSDRLITIAKIKLR